MATHLQLSSNHAKTHIFKTVYNPPVSCFAMFHLQSVADFITLYYLIGGCYSLLCLLQIVIALVCYFKPFIFCDYYLCFYRMLVLGFFIIFAVSFITK